MDDAGTHESGSSRVAAGPCPLGRLIGDLQGPRTPVSALTARSSSTPEAAGGCPRGDSPQTSTPSLAIGLRDRGECAPESVGIRARPLQLVGTGGIEPPASSASRKRSPTELRAYDRPPCFGSENGGVSIWGLSTATNSPLLCQGRMREFRARRSSPIPAALGIGERAGLSVFPPFSAILDRRWACGFSVTSVGPAIAAEGLAFLPRCRAQRPEERSATTV